MNFTTRSARFIERSDGSIVLSNAIGLATLAAAASAQKSLKQPRQMTQPMHGLHAMISKDSPRIGTTLRLEDEASHLHRFAGCIAYRSPRILDEIARVVHVHVARLSIGQNDDPQRCAAALRETARGVPKRGAEPRGATRSQRLQACDQVVVGWLVERLHRDQPDRVAPVRAEGADRARNLEGL